ncbi:Dbl homology domain-containing protein [Mycena sanguinolenta]|nr:Dbl homology domain-containing protein [Mycena sanguinolenta]
MHVLPSQLSLLPTLQTLYVDGNPFLGPWKALVEPLLVKGPSTPAYPLSTPDSAVPNTSNVLVLPIPLRTAVRRSFLPVGGSEGSVREPTPDLEIENFLRREEDRVREARRRALRSIMGYLKDMNDLQLSQHGAAMGVAGAGVDEALQLRLRLRQATMARLDWPIWEVEPDREGSLDSALRAMESMMGIPDRSPTQTNNVATADSSDERKFKDDKSKRAMVARKIVVEERTYVKVLEELVDIYIKPGVAPVNGLGSSSKDSIVPTSERKIVFGGIDALFSFHKESFLPALEGAAAPIMESSFDSVEADADGVLSFSVAKAIGGVFLKHSAFMKMYSSYINNFDDAVQHVRNWSSAPGPANRPSQVGLALMGFGITLEALGAGVTSGVSPLSTSQRKRLQTYLKRCRISPRHSQPDLEGYLLLPAQRIPRYRLLLEELLQATPPTHDYTDDPLDKSLAEISLLANNMNEAKHAAESRRKLVQWQSRIRGSFPSPLVQPHRRLVMDGQLLLTRIVRKASVSCEVINAQGDPCPVQVNCLAPELTPRRLVGVLCNDLFVLCRDPSEGQDPTCYVDLWAVLRMKTLPQPASIVHGNVLRLVDDKAILYFDAPSPSDTLDWCQGKPLLCQVVGTDFALIYLWAQRSTFISLTFRRGNSRDTIQLASYKVGAFCSVYAFGLTVPCFV